MVEEPYSLHLANGLWVFLYPLDAHLLELHTVGYNLVGIATMGSISRALRLHPSITHGCWRSHEDRS